MKRRVAALAILLIGALFTAMAADPPIVGAWQIDPAAAGQGGLYIFTPTHYSMVLAGTERPDIADANKATADELRSMWGFLLANSGTYDITGDLITIHPIAAKSPVVMKPGATEVYRFHIDGKTMTLQQVRNARGVTVENAEVRKFVRVE